MKCPDPRERPLLNVAEVAEWTGLGEKAVRSAAAKGQLETVPVGRYVLFPTAALLKKFGVAIGSEGPDAGTASGLATVHALTKNLEQSNGTPGPTS